MTTRYVGIGGNNASDGLSWANRKLTLNGVEDTPIEAGDTVYVGPGTYRELLTCDVDGTSGNPITYIGDFDGTHTDGVGGIVRITGSDDDLTATRANCIAVAGDDYRTFRGFVFDFCTSMLVSVAGDYFIIEDCVLKDNSSYGVYMDMTGPDGLIIRRCVFMNVHTGCYLTAGVEYNDGTNTVENCLFIGAAGYGVYNSRIGALTVKNCTIIGMPYLIRALNINTSYPMVVTNCILNNANYALYAAGVGMMTEDYNNIFCTGTARTNVSTGANSLAYAPLFDHRVFSQMLFDNGTMLTPFDLASYSKLIDVAGTTPTTADIRGTTVQGDEREWGALEYDSTLDIEAGTGGGGAVKIIPLGRVGL